MAFNFCYILAYSITDRKSFDDVIPLSEFILDQKSKVEDPTRRFSFFILMGLKCDLNSERQVPTDDGKNLAASLGCPFLEVSTVANINYDLVLVTVVKEMWKYRDRLPKGMY